MFRFTIRELVMLTAIVGLVCGWGTDRYRSHLAMNSLRHDMRECQWRLKQWESSAGAMNEYPPMLKD